ncbi:hypothetical protein FE257_008010 [Aspergillus nanangensis]|uniref:Peptidase M20 domain-containing protein 2 n=1 Tax=Aspergillus nanangensis TaxID=2582783 RepID=A0AAD4GV24_ASPNN|nr:hypothetical protein FE257_008010 [Aspergillus nanangensis]
MGSHTGTTLEQLARSIEAHKEGLWAVNQEIHTHPELNYQEVHAHNTLCDFLEKQGYTVTRHAYGLNTSFEAEAGTGTGPLIVYNAEYDALPEIGHACGHNLIATSSLAAFLATAEALKANNANGRVRLLGTPAEEGGGGKIALIKAGAYQGADACLMGHPGSRVGTLDGVVNARCMARAGTTITFRGVNAHAGNAPWLGRNALDAAVAAYTNISMLRQQIHPNQRVHAIISKGGEQPNIIPDLTEIQMFVRAETDTALQDTCQRIIACCEGAATGAGCSVDFKWAESYKDLQCSPAMNDRFHLHAQADNLNYLASPPTVSGASTDQGNVSYELPSLHPGFLIDVESPEVGPHHPKFAQAAGTRSAFDAALQFGKLMAATGCDILDDSSLRENMWTEHRQKFSNKASKI